jgi:hypothetical protein
MDEDVNGVWNFCSKTAAARTGASDAPSSAPSTPLPSTEGNALLKRRPEDHSITENSNKASPRTVEEAEFRDAGHK